MEHQTGPDGSREADAVSAAAAPGVPQSVPRADGDGPAAGEGTAAGEVGVSRLEDSDPDGPVTSTVRAEPVPATGEPRVDAALKLLGRLPGLPVSEHPELFEQVHAQLADVLGELDSGPAGPAGG